MNVLVVSNVQCTTLITRKMVPIKGRAKVKLFDVHVLCRFDIRKASFS